MFSIVKVCIVFPSYCLTLYHLSYSCFLIREEIFSNGICECKVIHFIVSVLVYGTALELYGA